jgi:ACS family glucarate transporter-like MFS transporter
MGLTAAASTLPALVSLRYLLGAFQAGIFPCATLIIAAWFPSTRRGLASAVLTSFMLIGGALGSLITARLIGPLGWRGLFVLYAVPGVVWAGWFLVWFRNRPREHPRVNNAELAIIEGGASASPQPTLRQPIPWARIFLNTTLFWICMQQFCRAGASRFFDNSITTYLQEARDQSVQQANALTSLPLWAGMLGGLVGGALSDAILARTGSRRLGRQGVAIGSLLASLVCYGLAYGVEDVLGAVLLFSLGSFVTNFASPAAYALTMDLGGKNLGVVFGTMNMAGNLGAWAFTWTLPRLVTRGGWDLGLALFVGMHVVAIVCWLLLNPNGVIGGPEKTSNGGENGNQIVRREEE